MYLGPLVGGGLLYDCDATSWFTRYRSHGCGRGGVEVKRLLLSRSPRYDWGPAMSVEEDLPTSEAISTRRRVPSENMSEMGQSSFHSVLAMVGARLVLKLRRRSMSDPQALMLLRWPRPSRRRIAYIPTFTASVLGVACPSGPSGGWGAPFPILPVPQPHSASDIERGQP